MATLRETARRIVQDAIVPHDFLGTRFCRLCQRDGLTAETVAHLPACPVALLLPFFKRARRAGQGRRGPSYILNPDQRAALAAAYAAGATLATLATEYGVSTGVVSRAVRACGVPLRPVRRNEHDLDAIIRRYRAGETLSQIGTDLGVSHERVRQLMERAGEPRRKATEVQRKPSSITPEQIAAVVEGRRAGGTLATIAAATGHSPTMVAKLLRRAGIDTTPLHYLNRPEQPWRCTTCKRTAAEGARFGTDPRGGRRYSRCKDCSSANMRAYYQRNAAMVCEKAKAKRAARRG